MGSKAQPRATQSASCYHNSTNRPLSQYRQDMTALMNQIDHHMGEIKRLLIPNTSPYHLAVEAKR